VDAEIIVTGALDGLSVNEIEQLSASGDIYPLHVVLSDGTTREISLYSLLPHLKLRLSELTAAGAEIAVIMCAGNFPELGGSIPVIYPGRVIPALVDAVSPKKRIGLIVPNQGQIQPAVEHWNAKGFSVKAVAISPQEFRSLQVCPDEMADSSLDLIVMDCMGFTPEMSLKMEILSKRTTICPQSLVARIAAEFLTGNIAE
jgi:protein AroM